MSASNRKIIGQTGGHVPPTSISPERFAAYVPRLLELVNDLVFSLSPDARHILYVNQAAQTIYGRPLSELLETENLWLEAIHESDRAELLKKMRSLDRQQHFEQDFRVLQPDGTQRFLQGSFHGITDEEGQRFAVGCIAKDVTNRIRAEAELEESKAIYHSLVESLPINVFRKDREGRVVFANNKYCETLGCSRPQLIGKTDFDLFDRELAEKYQKDDRWVLQTGLPFHDIEFHPRDDDSYIYVEVLKAPVTAANGRRIGIQGMFWDVTDRKNAEISLQRAKEMAEAASQAKSDFLANVSHEIRTPLNAVIGMTELLLSSRLDKSQREYLQMIQDSGQSLLTLINDILDFSKIESGKLSIENEWFDIRERVGDTLRTLACRAHGKQVDLICNIDPRIPLQLLGDAQRLRQIIVNLVGNSIKFTERGEIGVEVELLEIMPESVLLKFQIQDTGIGIPQEKLSEIFEEFVQVDTSSTRRYGGTGLGLSIASRLVRLMGGKLEAVSNVDRGSNFYFSLEFPVGANPPLPSAPEEFRNVSVLIVVASASVRASMENVLKSWRMKSYSVATVDQAIKLLRGMSFAGEPIQIVLADQHAAGIESAGPGDCRTLIRKMLLESEITPPRIVSMIKSSSSEVESQPMPPDVIRQILQPFKHSELRNAILQCLNLLAEQSSGEEWVVESTETASHILLAEDNPVNQKLAVGILEKYGHRVTVVENGRQALEAMDDQSFDLVLMDIQMPEMDGIEATKRIRLREQDGRLHIPIVAMTAHAMPADRQRCLEAGMDDFISKPFRASDLAKTVDQVIGRSAEQRRNPDSSGDEPCALVDWNRAFETVGGDRGLLKELIEIFLQERESMLHDLNAAIANGLADDIQRAAHSLKGALNHLGATSVARLAERVEKLEGHERNQASAFADQLQNELNQLTVELQRFTNNP